MCFVGFQCLMFKGLSILKYIMKRYSIVIFSMLCVAAAFAQGTVSLDSCRNMALRNNKEIQIANQKIISAGYNKQTAKAAYLPSVDATGSYFYNQKKVSLIDDDVMIPTKSFDATTGSYNYNLVTNPVDGKPIQINGQYVPSTVAVIPKSALTYDMHNVFAGALTVKQPIYMGGKIKAMNEITKYAEQLAKSMRNSKAQDIIYNVDAAYWQVVSLNAKHKLAVSYVHLLDSLDNNVKAMLKQGIATKSDLLSVDVKLNEANVDLTKVENGLVLSRMLLAQLCGLPVSTELHPADENRNFDSGRITPSSFNMNDVYNKRQDIHSLEIANQIYEQKAKVTLSEMLPTVAAIGMYSFSNPNNYNGFKKEFGGAFSIGAMVSIPIWHWKGDYNKYRAAKCQTVIGQLELADAKEKIELQVNQASFKSQEAEKTYITTKKNVEKANENLRQAQLGFKEGMVTTTNVMEAQTAWLKANSENIDAKIDVQLCDVYLNKVLGNMNY